MRKTVLFLPVLLFTGLFFYSCQKETSSDGTNKEIISKVNAWLESRKPVNKATQSANVELLRANLDFSALRIEQSSQNEKIVVIPVKEGLKNSKNLDKKAIPNLVLILDNMGNIRKGNIVLYLPASDETLSRVPNNTFYNILNTSKPDCNGKFRYLSITDKRLHELEYQGGRLRSFGNFKDSSINNGAGRTNNCIDWYWVTTYYDEFGMQVGQTWEYVGTTCQGENCEDPYNAMLCPMSNIGAGFGSPEEYEFAVSRPWKWDVAWTGDWLARSYESVTGVKNSTEPQGGHFTGISHNSSYFTVALPGYTWQELGNTTSIDNPQKVYSSTTGKVIYNGTFTTWANYAFKDFNQLF